MARSAVPLDTRSTPPAAPGEAGHGSLHARVMRLRGPKDLETTRIVSAARARRARTSTPRRRRVDGAAGAAWTMRLDPPGNAPRRSDSSTGIVGITRVGATSRARGRGVRSTSATDGATRPQRRKIRAICLSPGSIYGAPAVRAPFRPTAPRASPNCCVERVSRRAASSKTSGRGRARRSAPVLTASPRHSAAYALKPASHHC